MDSWGVHDTKHESRWRKRMNVQFFSLVNIVGFTDWWVSDKKVVHVDFNDALFKGYSEYIIYKYSI